MFLSLPVVTMNHSTSFNLSLKAFICNSKPHLCYFSESSPHLWQLCSTVDLNIGYSRVVMLQLVLGMRELHFNTSCYSYILATKKHFLCVSHGFGGLTYYSLVFMSISHLLLFPSPSFMERQYWNGPLFSDEWHSVLLHFFYFTATEMKWASTVFHYPSLSWKGQKNECSHMYPSISALITTDPLGHEGCGSKSILPQLTFGPISLVHN